MSIYLVSQNGMTIVPFCKGIVTKHNRESETKKDIYTVTCDGAILAVYDSPAPVKMELNRLKEEMMKDPQLSFFQFMQVK